MKVACVLMGHLPYKVELYRNPCLADRPVVVARTTGSKRVVYDFSPDLERIHMGMSLQQALSYLKGTVVLEADVAFYETAFARILTTLEQRSPLVAPGELGCAFVGLDGLARMYGGEARLIHALLNTVPEHLGPQVGLGEGKFPAYVAAQSALSGRAVKIPEDARGFLTDYPVEVLPMSWTLKSRLRSFGLETLGQLASLPVGALQAQFGPQGRLMWELANGIDRSPLVPRRTEETVSEWLSFPTPAKSLGVILLAVETLLGHAFVQPVLKGKYTRLATLEGGVYHGAWWSQRVPFREPVGNKDRALFAIKSKLENHPPSGPLEELRLTLSGFTGEVGKQASIFPHVRKRDQLREAIRHMEVSSGERLPIYQVREVERWSRLPERRHALVQYVP